MTPFFRLLLSLLTVLGLAAEAHDLAKESCVANLSVYSPELALRFLAQVSSFPVLAIGERLKDSSPAFNSWLTRKDLNWESLPSGARYDALGAFFGEHLDSYSEANWKTQASEQLRQELIHRGAKDPGLNVKDGYTLLNVLSAQNRERLWQQFLQRRLNSVAPQAPTAVQETVEQAVRELELVFVHNTTQLSQRPAVSLLSSKELVKIGVEGKLNTQPFNQKVLQSHGNIFFFAVPHMKRTEFPKYVSGYGDASLILDLHTARQRGWVSPYVMYPKELEELVQQTHPEVFARWQSAYEGTSPPMTEEAWEPLVRTLHDFDLTVDDILGLLQETLKISLLDLYAINPAQFDVKLEQLKSGVNLEDLINEFSLGQIGLRFGSLSRTLELKVPILVSPSNIHFRYDPSQAVFSYEPGRGPPIPKGRRFIDLDDTWLNSPY